MLNHLTLTCEHQEKRKLHAPTGNLGFWHVELLSFKGGRRSKGERTLQQPVDCKLKSPSSEQNENVVGSLELTQLKDIWVPSRQYYTHLGVHFTRRPGRKYAN